MNCKQFYASKKKPLALIAERTWAIPPPDISEESDLSSDSEDEFPLCRDTDNEADEGTVPEISSAESEGSDVDGILTADTDIDQLSATSSSVKGKNMFISVLFLFSLYRYILKVLIVLKVVIVLLDWFSFFEKF